MNNQTELVKPVVSPEVGTGPYKFLDYYVEEDKARFAGRERDIEELVARVMTDRVCVLYGRSGLGKTSLLLAGVFPELHLRGIQPVYVRVLESPLQDACRALAAEFNFESDIAPDQLLERLNTISPPPRILLVLDQFEEFFVRFSKQAAERKSFSSWLARMSEASPLDFRALISLREEYLSRLDEFSDDLPDMFGNEYRLRSLTAFGARQAIIRPLLEAGIDYDQRLVNRVVDMLAGEDFDSLLLQIVCSAIYREAATRREDHTHLREQDLEGVGGLEGILRRYLDSATQAVDPEHLLLCRTILDALITPEATKRAVTLDALLQADFTATKEEVEALLASLEKWRLVRKELRNEQMWYELTHERLVRHIVDWFKLDRTFVEFRAARDLIAFSSRSEMFRERPNTLLVPGQIEDVIGPFRERLRLDPVQTEFMFWSAVYRHTPSVGYWAKVLGDEKSRKALQDMLKHKDDAARSGAAAAAKEIPDPHGELARQCLELALHDRSETVRRSAGRSLAVLASPEEIASLKTSAGNRATRRVVREILVDIRLSGRDLRDFSFLTRLRAGRLANRRLFKVHAEAIRNRARVGMLSGLLGGLTWVCSVGFCLTVMICWLTGGIPVWGQLPPDDYLAGWGISIPIVVLLSTLVGWKAAKRAARRGALEGEDRSFYPLGSKRTLCLLLIVSGGALLAAIPIITNRNNESSEPWPSYGAFLAWVALLPLAAWSLVLISRHSVWPRATQVQIWSWSLLQSMGLPLLIPGALTLALTKNMRPSSEFATHLLARLPSFGVLTAGLLSLTSFVLLLALARASLRSPIGEVRRENPGAHRLSQSLALVGVLGFVCWFGLSFGATSIPFMAHTVVRAKQPPDPRQRSAPTSIKVTWPNSQYLRFRLDGSVGQWYRVTAPPSPVTLRFRTLEFNEFNSNTYSAVFPALNRDTLLFIPPGDQLASLSAGSPLSFREGQTLSLERVPDFESSAPLNLNLNKIYRQVKFSRDLSGREVWSTDFSGSLSPGTFSSDQVIRLTVLNPSIVPRSSEGHVSAQSVEHGFCSISSTASFAPPLSLGEFTLPSGSGDKTLRSGRMYPTSDERWLEIPLNDQGAFHVRLQFSAKHPEPPGPASGALKPVFPQRPDAKVLPENQFSVGVALQLALGVHKTAQTLNDKIVSSLEKHEVNEAISDARVAVRLWPEDDCSRNNLAWALAEAGKFRDALQEAHKAAELNPESAEIQDTLAHAAYGAQEWGLAVQAWNAALTLDPDFFAKRSDPACAEDKKHYDDAMRRASMP